MTIIQIDPLGTTSLLCTTSTVEDTVQDSDARSTTIAGLTTTLASSSGNIDTQHIHMNFANRYVESLTDEELAEMDRRLAEKEDILLNASLPKLEQQKVLKKTNQV